MIKKRLLTLGLTALVTSSLFAGCGTSDAATGKEDGKLVEIDFWYSGGKTAAGVLEEIVQDFNNSQSEYHVNTLTQADYSETYQKLQAGIAGNNAPDIALLGTSESRNLYTKGLVADINEYIKEDSTFDRDDYLEVFFDQGVNDEGNVFALPAYGTTQVFYYNRAAFEENGINPEDIKTWQDLEVAAKEMTKEDGSFIGWEPMWGYGNLVDAAFSNGAKILSDDGTKVLINSDEWIEVWEGFRKWIHEDKTMKIHYGGQGWEYWYKTMDDVLENRAGGFTGSSGDQADLDFSIVGAMEQPGWGNNPSAPAANALNLVMLEKSSDKEKQGVYELMKFFTSPENQAKWSMNTGYVAVRKSTQDVEEFKAYTDENPHALVPLQQAMHGSSYPVDPTGGQIIDALSIAADKVEIEGISAKEALDEAQKTAQEALDKALK